MNYIENLTQEEQETLCELIDGKAFKALFINNQQAFSRIKKGFRAKSVSEQQALELAKSNIDKRFIANFINDRVDKWLQEIREHIENLEREGIEHDNAVAETMTDSVFSKNLDLYFKLAGKTLEIDDKEMLCEKMKQVGSDRQKRAEEEKHQKIIEEKERQISDQKQEFEQEKNALRKEYEQKIQSLERERECLQTSLEEAQNQIAELQNIQNSPVIVDRDYIAQFDDTNSSILPTVDSNEIYSLCCVFADHSDQIWLIRYADLGYDGEYQIFHRDEDKPPFFKNRDKLFNKDGPTDDGFLGIWRWSAQPNDKDPSKDYIISRYNKEINVIEVVVIQEALNLDDLVELIKDGVKYQPHGRKILFSIYTSGGRYIGILCNAKDVRAEGEKITFSEECNFVPVYEFSAENIVRLNNGQFIYRYAFIGLPNKIYRVKSSSEIVKHIVLSSISWDEYKARGMIRANYRGFKDFLNGIPVDKIIDQIKSACRCSGPVAKDLLNDFLKEVGNYVDGESLEDDIIRSAISVNTEFQEKAKALVRIDWENENQNLIFEAKKNLESIDDEIKNAQERLTTAQDALAITKAEKEKLDKIIAGKETLAEDVEKAVETRINKARENAAEFIAEMAFSCVQTKSDGSKKNPVPYRLNPAIEDDGDLEPHHSWKEVIDTAAIELEEAGVAKQYCYGLASFLCAAYIEKQPLLLVGPNTFDIVQAFSSAVDAHKYGILSCEGNYNNEVTSGIGSRGESVVIINNLFESGWVNRLPEILAKKDILYIVTHPYAEDIQVEPHSIYGFMLPLFTEFFIDKKASGRYEGGYFAKDFITYSVPKKNDKDIKVLKKFTMSAFVRNKINKLVTIMYDIYPETTSDDEFLFAVLPIAFAMLKMPELIDSINESKQENPISVNLRHDLRYLLEADDE